MKPIYKSKKFYAALVALLFVFMGGKLGLTPEQVTEAVMVIVVLIGGIAAQDWGKEAKAIEAESAERMVSNHLTESDDE